MSDADGATALDPDDRDALIPAHIATRAELNAWEQANIARAVAWALSRRRGRVLDVGFIRELHRRMFDETWRWAGAYRRHDTNIGIQWPTIATNVAQLMAHATYWFENRTYDVDECTTRLHHRLTVIHAFPNGNGRHARLLADSVLTSRGHAPFTWGNADLQRPGDVRKRYLVALRAADGGDMTPLLQFVRS
jgi:Fic-DOC domain mobile mystery protein B